MKTSLRKLGGFARNGHGEVRERRDRRLQQSVAQLDEIARASQWCPEKRLMFKWQWNCCDTRGGFAVELIATGVESLYSLGIIVVIPVAQDTNLFMVKAMAKVVFVEYMIREYWS
ncbi:hypothetical protein Acr_06g0000380 [Actinidia rufa]|uniref:Uncharacterized protein n=1 Tax=Actinidia rufa TaxID=165716 RepID=A0A7J0ENP6_9ERIC|nr:hypothetical protein Acr_06g0000380 [Actinidia rufa]